MPKISIIVPAYNVEKYIEKSMSYIQNQTYGDFEVVIIDDGSDDKTGMICDNLAQKDSRFKVYHKSNGGVSAARNFGLEHITGTYMTFVDSDDWITEDYLQYLYDLITLQPDIDIAMTVGAEVSEDDLPVNIAETEHNIISAENAVRLMLLRKTYRHANWGKLYKTSVWKNVRFSENVIYDDYDTTYRVFANAKKVICGNSVKYSYVQRKGSLMHANCSEKTLTVLDVADNITDFLVKEWPESKVEALDMQIATYLKNMQAILNDGFDKFPAYQERIMQMVKSNAVIMLKSSCVPRNDKIKIIALCLSKHLFLKLYNMHDGTLKIKE